MIDFQTNFVGHAPKYGWKILEMINVDFSTGGTAGKQSVMSGLSGSMVFMDPIPTPSQYYWH